MLDQLLRRLAQSGCFVRARPESFDRRVPKLYELLEFPVSLLLVTPVHSFQKRVTFYHLCLFDDCLDLLQGHSSIELSVLGGTGYFRVPNF